MGGGVILEDAGTGSEVESHYRHQGLFEEVGGEPNSH
jgi:hypothetical protein